MPKIDVTVSDLVNWTYSGDLRLPEIQRRYVWTAIRVRDFFDSLYREYPSGTILVWDTAQDIETKDLAISPSTPPKLTGKRILLDGQQRITSLTAVIKGKPINVRDRQKPILLLFNLDHPEGPPAEVLEVEEGANYSEVDDDTEISNPVGIQEELGKLTFVVAGSSALKNNPHWIHVSDIFQKSDREILKPLGISSDDDLWDKYSKRLQRVRDIEKYPYVMQVLPSDLSYQEVTQIFVRVNSKGMKLRGHDLAVAQISARWKGFVDEIEKFADEFLGEDDYLIDGGIIVRTLVVFATNQCRYDRIVRVPLEKLKDSFTKTKRGLRYAIHFVLNNAFAGTLDNISSPNLLVPIALFSILYNHQISRKDENLLIKWFYLAHMRGHYGMGSSESILDADLAALFKTKNLQDLMDVLKIHVKKFNVDVTDIAHKNKNSSFFSMLYFILRQQNLLDWQTGLSLINSNTAKYQLKQHDHIFPSSLLKKEKYDSREINEISNIAFLSGLTNIRKSNKTPLDYFKKEVIPKWGTDALKSQLIPIDESLWEVKNYKYFLEFRREAIANYINEFMNRFNTDLDMKSESKTVTDNTSYGTIQHLEKELRLFIEMKLSSRSSKWWIQRIPDDVRMNAEGEGRKKMKNNGRGIRIRMKLLWHMLTLLTISKLLLEPIIGRKFLKMCFEIKN